MSEQARGLRVQGLSVRSESAHIVHPLSFEVPPGQMLAIIGESGSGKTMTARALTGLLPPGVSAAGQFWVGGQQYRAAMQMHEWRMVRGSHITLLLQDPFTSLSPVFRCGDQIAETIRARTTNAQRLSKAELVERVRQCLTEVHLPADVARAYPATLSGGMRQRVAIAAALAAEPQVLIADEPTTALDASNQGEVLDLLVDLQRKRQMSLILVSHDLGLVSGRADTVMVMRAGEVVERGVTSEVLSAPTHEYTIRLLDANPSITDLSSVDTGSQQSVTEAHVNEQQVLPERTPLSVVAARAAQQQTPAQQQAPPQYLLEANALSKQFGHVKALSDVSVAVSAGEVVAIVGESGSGKSTLARCIAGLELPDSGQVRLAGAVLSPGRKHRTPEQMQIVFQDPYSTLNPMFTVAQTIAEALRAGGGAADGSAEWAARNTAGASTLDVSEMLDMVELSAEFAGRRPSQLSGGQRQRVAIARALAVRPRVLICDESVSALDVSVQAQILQLIARLRAELNLGVFFITHDLGVVARIADRVLVLQGGRSVETGAAEQVLNQPQHAYTRMLVAAARNDSVGGA